MRRAIREHYRDFIAIIALAAAGLVVTGIILANQRTSLPDWVPVFGKDRFELKAEFSSAQAVTPGQGQSVDIAGIRVGDITGVELEDGHAVVDMEVENEYAALIHDDASLLLRPKTGLQDMVIEVDPGTSERTVKEGTTLPLASSLPNVNPDEILASLDADTQSFLRLLLSGAGEGLGGRGRQLSGALRQFEPLARDLSRINAGLALRRENVRNAIHNFRLVSEALGGTDERLTGFVDSSNAVLASFASQEASIRSALRELPSTLSETNGALGSANRFAKAAAPALRDLLPGARALAPALRKVRPFFAETVGPIRDQIRPFTTQVRDPVHNLRLATKGLGDAAPGLKTGFTRLNQGLNALAFNPEGSAESYLFYIPWLNHNTNSLFTLQDAHGPMRRGLVMASCSTVQLAESTALPLNPYLNMLAQLTALPTTTEIC
jgi:phospholipid/cholesterol/gamma-HCH transport system substrate-binding protein